MIAACILGLLSVSMLLAPTILRFMDWVDAADEAAVICMQFYRITVAVIETLLLLDFGLRAFPSIYRIHDHHDMNVAVEFAHNTLPQTTDELGVPATLAVSIAVIWPAVSCRRAMQPAPRPASYGIGAASAAVRGLHSQSARSSQCRRAAKS